MPNVPLDTRFVGFAPQTNLQERKSALINSLSQPYTMADIANTAGIPQLEVVLTGGYFLPFTNVSTSVRSIYPIVDNLLEFDNFWNADIVVDAESVTIPNSSYFDRINVNDDGNSSLISVNIPNLKQYFNADLTGISFQGTNLSNINIGEIGEVVQLLSIYIQDSALSEETVNYILALLVSLDGTNGTVLWDDQLDLSGGTSAAPTGQGLIDKQTLIDRGATVTTN